MTEQLAPNPAVDRWENKQKSVLSMQYTEKKIDAPVPSTILILSFRWSTTSLIRYYFKVKCGEVRRYTITLGPLLKYFTPPLWNGSPPRPRTILCRSLAVAVPLFARAFVLFGRDFECRDFGAISLRWQIRIEKLKPSSADYRSFREKKNDWTRNRVTIRWLAAISHNE